MRARHHRRAARVAALPRQTALPLAIAATSGLLLYALIRLIPAIGA